MIGERELRQAAEQALRLAQGDGRQSEVVLLARNSALTRFANNEIHQHVAERDATLQVRVAFGKRVGSASANRFDDETIGRVVEQASAAARLQPENPDFPGFPGPFQTAPDGRGCDEGTLAATPEARADRVAVVCARAEAAGLSAAGACSTTLTEMAVANSAGTWGYQPSTHARLLAVAGGDTSSGYSARQGAAFGSLDAEAVATEATEKAVRGRKPDDLDPGEYDVVLEPYAVQDLLHFVASLGLQGRGVLERTSFATGKLGQPLLHEAITLRDEPLSEAGLIQRFDYEGVPKRPLTLVERGVARAVTYDTLTAARAGTQTTGHAPPGPSLYGPAPVHLSLDPGTLDRGQLIGSIERGLLITRFWYTRAVHPLTVSITGMTRDSTFLIERGEITRPVRNLRFTQSYVRALQQVIGVGSEPLLVGDNDPVLTPALAIRGFTFTGKGQY